ncbi:MAG: hypothetical protein M1459_00425 [Patescibacteria group bacterium]|nr:hypothetical protein [Patescibacteria group bacterium]
MKNRIIFLTAVLISFILPQMAFASWWNPVSWSIWSRLFDTIPSEKTSASQASQQNSQANQGAVMIQQRQAVYVPIDYRNNKSTNSKIIKPVSLSPYINPINNTYTIPSHNRAVDTIDNDAGNSTTFGSNGTTYINMGATTFGSDGTTYNHMGNTSFGSDGTTYIRMGNTTFGSNGTTYIHMGGTSFGSDGTTYITP